MPYQDIKIPFGKHKGELVADIPDSYLEWLYDQEFVEEKYSKLYEMVKKEIDYREQYNKHIED